MTGATARPAGLSPETRKARFQTHQAAAPLSRLLHSEQLLLRARHASEWADAKGRSRLLLVRAEAIAKANIVARFAARWALIVKDKDDPLLAAKVEALRSEEAAELTRHTADLQGLITAERRASASLLKDRQRRERRALSDKHRSLRRYLIPVTRYAVLKSPEALTARARLVYFTTAGRLATHRLSKDTFAHGLPRLHFRRTGQPRD